MLQRLATLRRWREQKAREALVAQTRLLRQTEQMAQDAARAVSDHVCATLERERKLIGAVAGRAVSSAAIVRIQLELDEAALETARRRMAETQAQDDLQRQRSARAESLASFLLRQHAMAKLDHLSKEETARQMWWHEARSDAEAEDFAAAAGRRS
jgi:hypothetical protein